MLPGKGISVVALPIPYCKALNELPVEDSLISVIHGIQTMPLVIDRNIVAPEGFDEALGIWFAIPGELKEAIPNESECTFDTVSGNMSGCAMDGCVTLPPQRKVRRLRSRSRARSSFGMSSQLCLFFLPVPASMAPARRRCST